MQENCGSESDRLETQSGDCVLDDDEEEIEDGEKLDLLQIDSGKIREKDEKLNAIKKNEPAIATVNTPNFSTMKVDSMPVSSEAGKIERLVGE